jgi:hypothetical protein
VFDHAIGDLLSKFHHLNSYVLSEGVAGPSPYEHDGVGRNSVQVHGHGGAGPDAVCPEFKGVESESVGTDGACCLPDEANHARGGEEDKATVGWICRQRIGYSTKIYRRGAGPGRVL